MSDQERSRTERPPEALAEEQCRIHNIPTQSSDDRHDRVFGEAVRATGEATQFGPRRGQLDRIESKLDALLDALEVDDGDD